MKRALSVFALAFVGSCAADRPAPQRTATLLDEVRGLASFASIGSVPFRSSGVGRSGDLSVSLSGRALRLSHARFADAELTIESDVAAVESARGALPETDVLIALDRDRVEEIRFLRGARASHGAEYRLALGGRLSSARLVDRSVIVADDSGRTVFASQPPFAVDARGTRREVSVSLSGSDRSYVLTTSLDVEGLTFPIALDPAWTTKPAMSVARSGATATYIPSINKILVAGGEVSGIYFSTTELFDPMTSTWSAGPAMPRQRGYQLAVTLDDQRVLLVGGLDAGAYSAATDAFTPSTNTWAALPVMAQARNAFAIAKSTDGRVFASGGIAPTTSASAEVFSPTTNTWSSVASMPAPRGGHSLIPLPGGKVLVVGGGAGGIANPNSDVWDPATNTWSTGPKTSAARANAVLVKLLDGRYLMANGKSAEVFDPVASTWTLTGFLNADHANGHVAARLADGRVLVATGLGTQLVGNVAAVPTAEIFDPATLTWLSTSPLAQARQWAAASALPDGRVLIAGGTPIQYGTAVSAGEVFALLANGDVCGVNGDCASKLCIDGVCCNTACAGACEACDVTAGTCSPVTSGAPHGARSCAPFNACAAGVCVTTCTAHAECTATTFCSGGACVTKKLVGETCTASAECRLGNCVDGRCCNAACAGQCEACDAPGKEGSCTAIAGTPHGARAGCSGVGVGTTCGHVCDGFDRSKCSYPGPTVACSGNACKAGIETHGSACNGAGTCNDVPTSCASYGCGATACKSKCSSAADCATGFFCSVPSTATEGTCAATVDLGKECGGLVGNASTCTSGYCVEGVCCAVSSCGAGSSCALPGKKGTCSKMKGTPCGASAECGSGACVDGVCCESDCSGQCQACDVPGSQGTCIPVSGAPRGARPKCSDGGALCAARACDGKEPLRCETFANGPSVECKTAECNGAVLTPAAACDGKGACTVATSLSCTPFACASGACKTSCTTPTDCAPGNTCANGNCIGGVVCSPDRLSSIGVDGVAVSCGAYVCRSDGNCGTTCAASSECAGGFACDSASSRCVTTATGESSGGCSTGRTRRDPSSVFAALLALGATVRRRAIRVR